MAYSLVLNDEFAINDQQDFSWFGNSSAMSDSGYLIVGASTHAHDGVNWNGAAYLYQYSAGAWAFVREILASDGASGDYFGQAVGISGDFILATAPGHNGGRGAAYIYKISDPLFEQEITSSTVLANDNFGASGGISGDWIIIGAPTDDDGGASAGTAWSFRNEGPAPAPFVEKAKLQPAIPAANLEFGSSVAVNGTIAAIGAPQSGANPGMFFVFEEAGGVWTQSQQCARLAAHSETQWPSLPNGCYNFNIAVGTDVIVLGANEEDDAGADTGAFYIFEKSGGVWPATETQRVPIPAPYDVAGTNFGSSIAISDDLILVGARGYDGPIAIPGWYGAAFLFQKGTTWADPPTLLSVAFPNTEAEFGSTCCLSKTLSQAAVGAVSEEFPASIGIWSGSLRTYILSTGVVGLPIDVYTAGLYTDAFRNPDLIESVMVINTIPEDAETGVPVEDLIRLQIVSLLPVALDGDAKIWVTRSSTGVQTLVYDQAGGGFLGGWTGTATAHQSPDAGIDDELWITDLYPPTTWVSLETVLVEVTATAGANDVSQSYSFTIEDLTPATIEEILWLTPRRCRIKFSEPMNTDSTPGGSCFCNPLKGNISIPSVNENGIPLTTMNRINVGGTDVATLWAGYQFSMSGSAFPQNNRPRPINVSVPFNTTTSIGGYLTLNVISANGGIIIEDDGLDIDPDTGILVRNRELYGSVSAYYLEERTADEALGLSQDNPERIQVAHVPVPIACSIPTADELPIGEDPNQYVYVDWNDDISYGRQYRIHAVGIEDLYENPCSDVYLGFVAPMFNVSTSNLKFWDNGIIPPTDRIDDMGYEGRMREIAVVLQDTQNMLHNRVDSLQYLWDPYLCPDEWVDHLLYNLGNPFRFPLPTLTLKRRLAAALPELYKYVGTAHGIRELLYVLLGFYVEINAYLTADCWTLNDPIWSRLNINSILGPSSDFARNSYEIVVSSIILTDEQIRIITDVATWADPVNMHLIRIVDATGVPVGVSFWRLGFSALGLDTTLSL